MCFPASLTLPWDCPTQTAQSSVTLIHPMIKRKREQEEEGKKGKVKKGKEHLHFPSKCCYNIIPALSTFCMTAKAAQTLGMLDAGLLFCQQCTESNDSAAKKTLNLNILLVIQCAKYSVSGAQSKKKKAQSQMRQHFCASASNPWLMFLFVCMTCIMCIERESEWKVKVKWAFSV